MIKHLNEDFETVEYDEKKYVMFYDNYDNEEYPLHWHHEIEVIMPLRNHYTINIRDKKYELKENEIIFIPPGELHHILATPGRRFIIQFDYAMLQKHPLFSSIMRSISAPLHVTPEYSQEIHSLTKKTLMAFFKLYHSPSELAEIQIYSKFIELLIAIRDYQIRHQLTLMECDNDKFDEYSQMFDKVFKYIDRNYMYDISLESLAGLSGYSKFHFSRIFKQYSTVSYLEYLNERRVKAAEDMLLNSKISITEVAVRSGFKSLATFNRIFRKVKHCTPTEFKRLFQE